MVMEFSESEFNEGQLCIHDGFEVSREIAIRDLSELSRTLNIEKEQRKIEVVFSLIENVFAKETDSKLYGMLVERIPSLYVEYMTVEHLMKRVHKVFPALLSNALDHAADDVSDYFRESVP
uniref:DH domain-containing protein n=1 Tax=Elaeophora elaphi TaxID=1147741 RepID=A0A0R3RZG4_9BILA